MKPDSGNEKRSYELSYVIGTSTAGFSDATDFAIAQAFEQNPNLDWYEVEKLTGTFQKGKILGWEVLVKVGTADRPPSR